MDTDGLSVFEVETEEQRGTVVAAIACDRQNMSRVDLMEVSREQVESYGPIERTPAQGNTALPAANELHRSLDWDAPTLRRFAEDLFDGRREPREYAPAVVRALVRNLDPATLVGEDAQAFVRRELAKTRKVS